MYKPLKYILLQFITVYHGHNLVTKGREKADGLIYGVIDFLLKFFFFFNKIYTDVY